MLPANDPQAVRQQYATDHSWRIRFDTHEKYSVPRHDFAAWALRTMKWRGDEHILDVGCGTGRYFELLSAKHPNIHYSGVDFSAGMLHKHAASGHLQQADAQQLPFKAGSFDVIMANHMLFHVADIDTAITEFRRVLKPGGVLMATTNSLHTMPEFQVLFRRAIVLLGTPGSVPITPPAPPSDLFALENGGRQLARHFYAVVRYDLPSTFVFPSVEPVIAYLESTRNLREPQLPDGVRWDDLILIMRQQIGHLLNHFGELVVNKLAGVLVASDAGGFIQEYVQQRSSAPSSVPTAGS